MARGNGKKKPADDLDSEAGTSQQQRRGQKRPAQQSAQHDEEDPPQVPAAAQDAPQEGAERHRDGRRREGMAEIARRRAAHFANYRVDDDEEDNEGNEHVGGNEARSLGPWSSAVQLVNARADAAAKRSDKILDAQRAQRTTAKGIKWTPSRDVSRGPRIPCRVQALADMCVAVLVEYIEDVESLWGLPDAIKVRLAAAVCARRRMSPEVVRLFTEGAPIEVVLPECTQLEPNCLAKALRDCATPKLEVLELGFCGRGVGAEVAASLAGAGPLTSLAALALNGAYRLTDDALEAILRAAPSLTKLGLGQCSRLQGSVIEQLLALTPLLRTLDLAECRGLSAECMARTFAALPALEALVLDGIPEVGDATLAALPGGLRELSVSHCAQVTDKGLRSLAQRCPRLQVLRLDEVSKVGSPGVQALAEHCKELRVLSVRKCAKVSDEAVAAVARHGTLEILGVNDVPGIGAATMQALATSCKDRLEELDVSWCQKVSNEALGLVADSCTNLQRLHLWGCSHIGEPFLQGHSNSSLEVLGKGELTYLLSLA